MEIRRVGRGWTITLTQSSDFVDRRPDAVGISKAGFKLANKVFMLLSKGDCFSRSGANHAKAQPLSNVPIRPIRDASVGYLEGCI